MSQLINERQTQREQARAIFDWIRNHVSYTSDGPKDSVYEGAYRALQYGQGDCYTFYAIAEVMLTKAGIPNQMVTRVESKTRHYWNLVNCDENGWLHFDSTPTNARSGVSGDERFLFTESQAAAFTERIRDNTGARDYYTYDKSLHPDVVE
jgi:transglutaminase-like putative cysteine protease